MSMRWVGALAKRQGHHFKTGPACSSTCGKGNEHDVTPDMRVWQGLLRAIGQLPEILSGRYRCYA